ncbi:MAG TPA: hypothetical protein VEB64_08195 [Azospirillaceae bacterium]|nr:hypothetical protein [Azospirillaceae bacterium]
MPTATPIVINVPTTVRVNGTATMQQLVPAMYWSIIAASPSITVKDLTTSASSGYVINTRTNQKLQAGKVYTVAKADVSRLAFRGGKQPGTDRIQVSLGPMSAIAEIRTVRATTTRSADAMARVLAGGDVVPLSGGTTALSKTTQDDATGLLAALS